MSFVKDLGYLGFASRLRILAEKVAEDGEKIYKDLGLDFQTRWFATFYLLHTHGPMSITDIAAKLNFSHPAVIQITKDMLKAELLTSKIDMNDARKRILSISKKGEQQLNQLSLVWQCVESNVSEMFEKLNIDMLKIIDVIEQQIEMEPISKQVVQSYRDISLEDVCIIPYSEQYANDFKEINLQWLNEYFSVEDADKAILSNPNKIVEHKGAIFFAVKRDKVIGTLALINQGESVVELAKMGVVPQYRNLGVGRKMIKYALSYAKKRKIITVIVKTSSRLQAANHLYQSLGFSRVSQFEQEQYQRPTITYQIQLEP